MLIFIKIGLVSLPIQYFFCIFVTKMGKLCVRKVVQIVKTTSGKRPR